MPGLTPVDNSWSPGSKPTNDYNPISQNQESSDPVDHTGGANVSVNLSVDNNDPLANTQPRINQQQIIPDSVKNRFISPVTDIPDVATVSGIVNQGDSALVTTTVTNNSGGLITTKVFYQIYVDDKSPDRRMPQRVSSQIFPYTVMGSLFDEQGNSIVNQPAVDVQTLQVRNNDMIPHLFIFDIYVRIVQNGQSQNIG